MSRSPLIEVDHLSKDYLYWKDRPGSLKRLLVVLFSRGRLLGQVQRIPVLENVSFTVGAGEFIGVMGRNGAGKSTLMKIISGIYQPSSGTVRTRGKIAPLLELGAGFVGDLSGRENIYINTAILGFSREETNRHLQSIIDFSELGEHIEMPVKNYSSGMLVRLGFSIAVHMNAPILLFDEVMAVGDIGFQQKCLRKIEELHGEGRAIILVTHSPEAVVKHCTRCLVFENKRLIFDGPPADGARVYEERFNSSPASF